MKKLNLNLKNEIFKYNTIIEKINTVSIIDKSSLFSLNKEIIISILKKYLMIFTKKISLGNRNSIEEIKLKLKEEIQIKEKDYKISENELNDIIIYILIKKYRKDDSINLPIFF
jgi:hypothetical protein